MKGGGDMRGGEGGACRGFKGAMSGCGGEHFLHEVMAFASSPNGSPVRQQLLSVDVASFLYTWLVEGKGNASCPDWSVML